MLSDVSSCPDFDNKLRTVALRGFTCPLSSKRPNFVLRIMHLLSARSIIYKDSPKSKSHNPPPSLGFPIPTLSVPSTGTDQYSIQTPLLVQTSTEYFVLRTPYSYVSDDDIHKGWSPIACPSLVHTVTVHPSYSSERGRPPGE